MNILFAILLISLFVIIQGYSVSNFGSKVNLVELRNNKDRISMTTSRRSVVLPEKLIVGYANWNQCDEKIIESVRQGVNVVIWFSINLAVDNDGNPTITNGPDMHCVADIVKKIRDMNLETVHLISIGGWNSPHPDTTNPTENVYAMWNKWNTETIASPEKGFYGFDGFDWDIEGMLKPFNSFDVK